MTDYIKNLDAAIFTDPTGCGKSPLVFRLGRKRIQQALHYHYFPNASVE